MNVIENVKVLKHPTGAPMKPAKVVPLSCTLLDGGGLGGFFATEVDVGGNATQSPHPEGDVEKMSVAPGSPGVNDTLLSASPDDDPYEETMNALLGFVDQWLEQGVSLDTIPLERACDYTTVVDTAIAAEPGPVGKTLTGMLRAEGMRKLIDAGVWMVVLAHLEADLEHPRQALRPSVDATAKNTVVQRIRAVQGEFFTLMARWYGELFSKVFAKFASEVTRAPRGLLLHQKMDRVLGQLPVLVARVVYASALDCFAGIDRRDPTMFRKGVAGSTHRWFTGVDAGEDAEVASEAFEALRRMSDYGGDDASSDGRRSPRRKSSVRRRSVRRSLSRASSHGSIRRYSGPDAFVNNLKFLLGVSDAADDAAATRVRELTRETAADITPEEMSAHSLAAIVQAANEVRAIPAPQGPAPPGGNRPGVTWKRMRSIASVHSAASMPRRRRSKKEPRRKHPHAAADTASAAGGPESPRARAAEPPRAIVPQHRSAEQASLWFQLGEHRSPHVVVSADGSCARLAVGQRCDQTSSALAQSCPLLVEYFRQMNIRHASDSVARHAVKLTPRTDLDRAESEVRYNVLAQASLAVAQDAVIRERRDRRKLRAAQRKDDEVLHRQIDRLASVWRQKMQDTSEAHKELVGKDPTEYKPTPRPRKPRPPVQQKLSRDLRPPRRMEAARRATVDTGSDAGYDGDSGSDDEVLHSAQREYLEKVAPAGSARGSSRRSAHGAPSRGYDAPDGGASQRKPLKATAAVSPLELAMLSPHEFLALSPKAPVAAAAPPARVSPALPPATSPSAAFHPAPPPPVNTLRRWKPARPRTRVIPDHWLTPTTTTSAVAYPNGNLPEIHSAFAVQAGGT